MIRITDVIPVSPWNALDLRRRGASAREAGIQVVLEARVHDAERLRGVPVTVESPGGGRRDWVVCGVEVLRGGSVLFLSAATVADVPPGSRLTWPGRGD